MGRAAHSTPSGRCTAHAVSRGGGPVRQAEGRGHTISRGVNSCILAMMRLFRELSMTAGGGIFECAKLSRVCVICPGFRSLTVARLLATDTSLGILQRWAATKSGNERGSRERRRPFPAPASERRLLRPPWSPPSAWRRARAVESQKDQNGQGSPLAWVQPVELVASGAPGSRTRGYPPVAPTCSIAHNLSSHERDLPRNRNP